MFDFIKTVVEWYMNNINYLTITIFMTIESSFIPFPSEIVVPPAAWKAAQGQLNIYLVVFFATVGSMIGALINYFLAKSLGRAIIYKLADTKLAHLIMIDKNSVVKAEDYFNKYGKSSTFIGRLVPAVRQLISIPAGLAKMKMKDFLLFTFLGATAWNVILAVLGYFLYSQKELLEEYYKEITFVMLGLGVLFVAYLIVRTFFLNKNKKNKKKK